MSLQAQRGNLSLWKNDAADCFVGIKLYAYMNFRLPSRKDV